MSHTDQPSIVYKDFWPKIIGCIIISAMIDSLGRAGSILDRINTKHFFIDLMGGFFIALLLWELVRFVTLRLDKRLDWYIHPIQRIAFQLFFGVIIPAFLSFVFTLFFMQVAHKQDIFQTTWLHSEFYAVILIILLVNLVYFTWWLILKTRENTN